MCVPHLRAFSNLQRNRLLFWRHSKLNKQTFSRNKVFLRRIVLVSLFVICFFLVLLFITTPPIWANGQFCRQKHWEIPINTFDNPKILRSMDLGIGKYAAGHRGIDLYADNQQIIIAPEDGIITWKGVAFGTPTITFTIDGKKNTFQPAKTDLKTGTFVKKGEALGHVQQTDIADNVSLDDEPIDSEVDNITPADETDADIQKNPHEHSLHWGVSIEDNIYLNPLAFVYRTKIVLTKQN